MSIEKQIKNIENLSEAELKKYYKQNILNGNYKYELQRREAVTNKKPLNRDEVKFLSKSGMKKLFANEKPYRK